MILSFHENLKSQMEDALFATGFVIAHQTNPLRSMFQQHLNKDINMMIARNDWHKLNDAGDEISIKDNVVCIKYKPKEGEILQDGETVKVSVDKGKVTIVKGDMLATRSSQKGVVTDETKPSVDKGKVIIIKGDMLATIPIEETKPSLKDIIGPKPKKDKFKHIESKNRK